MAVSKNKRVACKRAAFVDKDGTIVTNVPYNADTALMTLAPGAGDGLRLLQGLGYELVVVSNQSGVAHGYFPEEAVWEIRRVLEELLAAQGVALRDFLYCPHHPDGSIPRYARPCSCRKPGTAMLLDAARVHGLDLSRSWMIGDILDDVEAGAGAGCRTVLVDGGGETEWLMSPARTPTIIAQNLLEAAELIAEAGSSPSAPTGKEQQVG